MDNVDKINSVNVWDYDEDFSSLINEIEGYTLVDRIRCFILYELAKQADNLNGDVAEVGVYKGGTAKLISLTVPNKTIHLFDTFIGMPPTSPDKDLHQTGDFADTTLEAVAEYLSNCKNARLYKGFFPDTAIPLANTRFCFVHVDVDIYTSVISCCQFFYPRMETNGVIIFDDYGFVSCPGAKMAVDEFFSSKPEYPCYLPTGQCFVIKL